MNDARNQAAAATKDFDEVLARYVVACPDGVNRVRYRAWQANPTDRHVLNRYVDFLQDQRPSAFPPTERMAYWINLYNAVTLQIILENYPVKSIREVRSRTLDPRGLIGPWFMLRVTVEGRNLSLDQIENAMLRKDFSEPRVHYAINCASEGCPNIQPRAWRADTLDDDLNAAAGEFVNSNRGAWIGANGGVHASRIYKWFAKDFGPEGGVVAHLRKHATPDLQAGLGPAELARHDYDWSLNDAEPPSG